MGEWEMLMVMLVVVMKTPVIFIQEVIVRMTGGVCVCV